MKRPFRPLVTRLPIPVLLGAMVACGGDATGPDPEGPVLQQFCIRGSLAVTGSVSGTLDAGDCATESTFEVLDVPVGANPGASFEGWRVRVSSGRSVTFDVVSSFDSFLDVFLVPNPNQPATADFVAFDDDSGEGLNAMVTVALAADTEYWVFVSGFSAEHLGPYTLRAQ